MIKENKQSLVSVEYIDFVKILSDEASVGSFYLDDKNTLMLCTDSGFVDVQGGEISEYGDDMELTLVDVEIKVLLRSK